MLTAVLLTQMSVGKSIKATLDYVVGTIAGAVFAGAIGALVPHDGEAALALVLGITLLPVTLIAARDTRFGAAPFTTVIVLLAPTIAHIDPLASAIDRVLEVAVGSIIGVIVSVLVLPERASDLALHAAVRVLDLMAQQLPSLFRALTSNGRRRPPVAGISEAYAGAQALAVESAHERFAATPNLDPLLQALLGLQHDLTMIEQLAPLPMTAQVQLKHALTEAAANAAVFLRASGAALTDCECAVGYRPVDTIFDDCAAALRELERAWTDQNLLFPARERIFALSFAFESLRRHFGDLERSIAELSDASAPQPRRQTCPHGRKELL